MGMGRKHREKKMHHLKHMSAKHWSSTGEMVCQRTFQMAEWPKGGPRETPNKKEHFYGLQMAGNLAACDWTYTNSPGDRFIIKQCAAWSLGKEQYTQINLKLNETITMMLGSPLFFLENYRGHDVWFLSACSCRKIDKWGRIFQN